jgi:hypothetical protein
MIIIRPTEITPAKFVSSTAAVSTRTAWSSVTAYVTNNEVYYNFKDWIAIAGSTNVIPGSDATKWLEIGASNRYAMFDNIIGNVTTGTSPLNVRVTPSSVVNAVSLFEVSANTVQLQIIDPIDGIVYDKTINMIDVSVVVDWYSYFFEGILLKDDVTFIDLPAYGSADVVVIANNGASSAVIGECVIGFQKQLGVSNFNTSVSIQDYSRKERDQFGQTKIVERRFTKLAEYDVTVETNLVSYVQKALAELRSTPTVFIGDSNRPETVVFGYYKNFNIVISTPTISDCTIAVEGLI